MIIEIPFYWGDKYPDKGELAALVGVEYLRRTTGLDSFLQSIDTETGVERVGYTPRQYLARIPVHDRDQVHKAPGHRDIRDIRCPHMIRAIDDEASQQVRIHLVCLVRQAEVALRVLRHPIHRPHQALDLLAVNPIPMVFKPVADTTTAVKRVLQVTMVDQRYLLQLLFGYRPGHVIERRA